MILYKTIDICTKSWYFVVMEITRAIENEEKDKMLERVCTFFHFEHTALAEKDLKATIKELCVVRLLKAIGLTKGIYNHKSEFFNFFATIMGEAVCQKLDINLRIASDELRLVRYNNINFIKEVKAYLDNESQEEAFLDAFNLVDDNKYLIPLLKKI